MFQSIFCFLRFVGSVSSEARSSPSERFAAKLGIVLIVACVFLGVSGGAFAHGGANTTMRNRHKHRVEKRINHRQGRVARTAQRWTGIPYVYGGSSRSGVDCSGLTLQIYDHAIGIRLPHSSALQATYGSQPGWRRVWKIKDLRRGDLMFLAGTWKAGISHTAVVVDRRHAVAATSSGTLSRRVGWSSYTYSHFAYGIRPPMLRPPRYR